MGLGTTFPLMGDLHPVALLFHTHWPGLEQDPGAHPSGGELERPGGSSFCTPDSTIESPSLAWVVLWRWVPQDRLPGWGKRPPPAPSSASHGCLPGCSAVIYWQLLLARAHGRRSSNTRKKSHQLLIPESGFPSAPGHSSRSLGAGAAALPFFFFSAASHVIPPGCAPLTEVTRRARRVTACRGGESLCLLPLSWRSLSRQAPRGWSGPLWTLGF